MPHEEHPLPSAAPVRQIEPSLLVPPRVTRFAGICRDGWPFVGIGAMVSILVCAFGGAIWSLLPGFFTLFSAWFFRDPERTLPEDPNALVSPADGTILSVERKSYPRLLSGEATRVSIFMSPLNVHVNRSPFGGTIRATHYNPGEYFAAFEEKASLRNEQSATVVDTDRGVPVMFVQIAGFIARRIINRAHPGERVERGERFGLIRFGSRTDLYLPDNVEVRVKKGDKVAGGETVIGVFR